MRYHWLLAYFPRSICDKAAAPMHLAKALEASISRVLSFQRGVSKILREDHVNHADYTPNLPPPNEYRVVQLRNRLLEEVVSASSEFISRLNSMRVPFLTFFNVSVACFFIYRPF